MFNDQPFDVSVSQDKTAAGTGVPWQAEICELKTLFPSAISNLVSGLRGADSKIFN